MVAQSERFPGSNVAVADELEYPSQEQTDTANGTIYNVPPLDYLLSDRFGSQWHDVKTLIHEEISVERDTAQGKEIAWETPNELTDLCVVVQHYSESPTNKGDGIQGRDRNSDLFIMVLEPANNAA